MSRKKHRIVAEVKAVKELKKHHIDTMNEKYSRHPWYPQEKHVVITKRTKVSEDVREHAKQKKWKIVRLRKV